MKLAVSSKVSISYLNFKLISLLWSSAMYRDYIYGQISIRIRAIANIKKKVDMKMILLKNELDKI